MIAAEYQFVMPGFSVKVMLTLLLVLGLSVAVFVWQVRRWTTHRGWRALLDWSRERSFKLSRPNDAPGEPFERLGASRVSTRLEAGRTKVFQLLVGEDPEPTRWHVLVREMQSTWPATGLRPAHMPVSLLDQFSLSSYPAMGEVERFVVFGTDSQAARTLSKSQGRALLPPDVGLLMHGRFMVLDFSTRPFDGIELGRMVALADQLEQHLPLA